MIGSRESEQIVHVERVTNGASSHRSAHQRTVYTIDWYLDLSLEINKD